MRGYFGEADVWIPGDWRPTGDLVEVVGDRLLFTGRSSDVINVGGVKVHPLRSRSASESRWSIGIPGVRSCQRPDRRRRRGGGGLAAPGADADLVDAGESRGMP